MNIAEIPQVNQKRFLSTLDEVMTRSVHVVHRDDSVLDALKIMVDGFNSLPVVNDQGECLGMLSRADITEMLFKEDQQLANFVESEGAPAQAFGQPVDTCGDRIVRELMTDEVVYAETSTTVFEACQLMANHSIHHLPVAGYKRKIIGMVSSLDLIRWLSNLDSLKGTA